MLPALIALLAVAGAGRAQERGAEEPGARPDAMQAVADTAAEPGAAPPPISPLGAFARSFVLPGWGQVAVNRPVRGAAYFALEAASLFMVAKTQAKLDAARKGQAAGERSGLVESRIRQREDWIVLSAFWALMSGVDAWISAHMYDFQQQISPPDDEARLDVGPAGDGAVGLRVAVRVPIRLP